MCNISDIFRCSPYPIFLYSKFIQEYTLLNIHHYRFYFLSIGTCGKTLSGLGNFYKDFLQKIPKTLPSWQFSQYVMYRSPNSLSYKPHTFSQLVKEIRNAWTVCQQHTWQMSNSVKHVVISIYPAGYII